MKFKYSILFFLVLSFCFGARAMAVDTIDQQQTATTPNTLYYNGPSHWRYAGQQLTPGHTNISRIDLLLDIDTYAPTPTSRGTTTPIYFTICKGTPAPTSRSDFETKGYACNWSGNSVISYQLISGMSTDYYDGYGRLWVKYELVEPIQITSPGDNYYFVFSLGITAEHINPGYVSAYGGLLVNTIPNVSSLNYKTYYDDAYTPPEAGWSITAIHPLTGNQILTPSVYFSASYTTPAGADGYAYFWTETGGGYQLHDYGHTASTTGSFTDTSILTDGSYTWYAGLIDYDTGATVATTSVESFTVGYLSVPTDENLCDGIATSTGITDLHIFGDIECGLKKVGYWAIHPSDQIMSGFAMAYVDIKGAFPFNAFFGLTTAITDTISTTTLSTTGTLPIPFISSTGTIFMLPIISSSTISRAIGATNATLFRNTLGWLMWFAVAFLIFIQFKKIT